MHGGCEGSKTVITDRDKRVAFTARCRVLQGLNTMPRRKPGTLGPTSTRDWDEFKDGDDPSDNPRL